MEGRNLVEDALKDADALRKAATEAAKNELIEALAPQIKKLVESSLRGAVRTEDTDRLRRGVQDNWPGESHTGFEESKRKGDEEPMHMDKKSGEKPEELDVESIMAMIPGLSEEPDPDADPDADPAMSHHMGEDADPDADPDAEPAYEAKKKGDDEDEKMDETVEISDEQLSRVYEEAMKAAQLAEVEVKKGFSDMTPAGEIEDVIKDVDKGLADVKKGEAHWEKEEPPHKQDFTVKEQVRRLITMGKAENAQLRARLGEALKVIGRLRNTLHETNLFNSKVLQVNRIFNAHGRLTKEQKLVVVESIDRAKSIDEVKTVARAITSSFKASGTVSEGRNPRKPAANAQRARTSGTPNGDVLRESVDREQGQGGYGRLRQLAGLGDLVK